MSEEWRLLYPWALCLLVIPLGVLLWRVPRGGASFGATHLAAMVVRASQGPMIYRGLMAAGLTALIIAAARPQFGRTVEIHEHQGRDLMLVIDLSLSMITDDMQRDDQFIRRLDAVMDAAHLFIEGRAGDRIGLAFFAEQALVQCPLTADHETVRRFLEDMRQRQNRLWQAVGRQRNIPSLLGSGTNLGLGIARGLAYLEGRESNGRSVILITDGKHSEQLPNSIRVDPDEAAIRAADLDIRVHTIGVGNRNGTMTVLGTVNTPYPTRTSVTGQWLPDMRQLQAIAQTTGGVAMHADSPNDLERIFAAIDELEPTSTDSRQVDDYPDRFEFPLILGLALLLVGWLAEPRLRGPL